MAFRESRPSASPDAWKDLLGTPWLEGGRDGDDGTDCLGVCLRVAQRRGLPWVDPWELVRERWAAGERDIRRLFVPPDAWTLLGDPREARRNDVLLFTVTRGELVPGHIGFLVEDGLVLSAREGAGVYSHPLHRMIDRVVEVWRIR